MGTKLLTPAPILTPPIFRIRRGWLFTRQPSTSEENTVTENTVEENTVHRDYY